MFMLYLALCLETRTKVLDTFDVPLNTSSIFIGMDSPKWDLALQLQKLGKGMQLTPSQISMMDSQLLGRGVRPKPDIMAPGFVDWLKELNDIYHTDIIFIDTLRRVHSLNENASDEMSKVMERLESFVDEGRATIILSTHTSKPTGVERSSLYNVRGSTVISGSADFHYSLTHDKKGRILFDGTSKRRGENKAKGYLVLEYKETEGGLKIQIAEEEANPVVELIYNELAMGERKAPELVAATGGSYYQVQRALRTLQASGRVKKAERGLWSLQSL